MVFAQYNLFERICFWIDHDGLPGMSLERFLASILSLALVALCLALRLKLEEHKALFETIGAVFVCSFAVFSEPFITSRPLDYLGKHSANIFLFHTFIVTYFFSKQLYSLHSWLLITAVLVFSCLAISWIIEKVKQLAHFAEFSNRTADFFANLVCEPNWHHTLKA